MEISPAHARASILAAGLAGLAALLLGNGFGRFGYPPLIPLLIQHHWFSAAQAAYLGSGNLAGYLLGAVVAGRYSSGLPVPSTTRLSMLAIALSFVVCGVPAAYSWFMLWRVLAGAAGGFLMVITVPSLLAGVPVHRRGRAGGIMFMGIGAGIVFSGTVVPILGHRSLFAAWMGMGAVSALLTVVTWAYWRHCHRAALPASPPQQPAARRPPMMKSGAFRRLLAMYCLAGAGLAPHAVFWVDFIARGLGKGMASGGRYWVLFGVSAALGPLAVGVLGDRIGFRASLRWCFLVETAAVIAPLLATAPWALAFSSAGVGSMALGITTLASGRVAEVVGHDQHKPAWGWMTVGFSLCFAGAAWILAYLFAHTGSHRVLFMGGGAALACGALLAWLPGGRTAGKGAVPVEG